MMIMFHGGYEKAKAGTVPDLKDIETMRKYNEQLQKVPASANSARRRTSKNLATDLSILAFLIRRLCRAGILGRLNSNFRRAL